MRTIKRTDCAVLHLGLRRYWYHMIDSGCKCVEFREASHYWNVRIANWLERMEGKTPILEFQNGYSRFSPRMTFVAGRGEGQLFDLLAADVPIQHKELGEFPKDRYVLFIGERVHLV